MRHLRILEHQTADSRVAHGSIGGHKAAGDGTGGHAKQAETEQVGPSSRQWIIGPGGR